MRTARFVSGGFLDTRIRRIAWLSGIDLRTGLPRTGEAVAAWGHAGTSRRAEAVAARTGAEILRFEDAWLRSLHPGRARPKEPTLGLLVDRRCHFDARGPSDLEDLLAHHPFDDGDLIGRARAAMDEMVRAKVTKYAATAGEAPAPGYVLLIDQTSGDASIALGGASAATFGTMLATAREEHPHARLLIKTHPETARGHRAGHFAAPLPPDVELWDAPTAPADLFAGAVAVYCVTSQLGFEAILHGHRPVVLGQPFYAGWGLTDDRRPVDRRTRHLTRAQLFAGAMVLYPKWYDAHRDELCGPVEAVRALEARARAWREDRDGWSAPGTRLWKRPHVKRFLSGRVSFGAGRRPLVWGDRDGPDGAVRMEDGFLRSKGLGADLVPPLSLVLDGAGMYYDPTRGSDLEACVIAASKRPPEALARARALRSAVIKAGLSKYNLAGDVPDLPADYILVPGQVADDASMRHGAPGTTNEGLLRAARAAFPEAVLVYKPHPDVEAGLRDGAIDAGDADLVAAGAPAVPLIAGAARVWTATSLMGFEALMRGVPVSCVGTPFYAGWGLTDDRGPVPARRRAARPSLDALVHAALIAYPRYFDPVTRTACPPEVAVDRLAHGPLPCPGPANRGLAKLQGAFASVPFWR
ncbi:capsular polysaccharide biosynthesis protein [Jannaschia sp. Os4]|uniref:capsular polysaccharide biosynthesis protein n=1 Tax=Jannaschia sp. Os4 TaxID=2807617 RepID=UPI001939E2AE|nr:capsular polysaccharide biosynthesis protein [Jannaschia sp. Os4]MBM2577930.1 capsular polysaccharide biosynthesis protein [Jannaschia sp. Os4]